MVTQYSRKAGENYQHELEECWERSGASRPLHGAASRCRASWPPAAALEQAPDLVRRLKRRAPRGVDVDGAQLAAASGVRDRRAVHRRIDRVERKGEARDVCIQTDLVAARRAPAEGHRARGGWGRSESVRRRMPKHPAQRPPQRQARPGARGTLRVPCAHAPPTPGSWPSCTHTLRGSSSAPCSCSSALVATSCCRRCCIVCRWSPAAVRCGSGGGAEAGVRSQRQALGARPPKGAAGSPPQPGSWPSLCHSTRAPAPARRGLRLPPAPAPGCRAAPRIWRPRRAG